MSRAEHRRNLGARARPTAAREPASSERARAAAHEALLGPRLEKPPRDLVQRLLSAAANAGVLDPRRIHP